MVMVRVVYRQHRKWRGVVFACGGSPGRLPGNGGSASADWSGRDVLASFRGVICVRRRSRLPRAQLHIGMTCTN